MPNRRIATGGGTRGWRASESLEMRLVIATDDDAPVVGDVERLLRERGHDVSRIPTGAWGEVAVAAGER